MHKPQGLPHDLYICNIKRDEELSKRIAERNIPSSYLEPQFSQRPVSTKYALLPIVDRRKIPNVPIDITPTYNVNQIFNPGNTVSPWSGFASNINIDSKLRNQFFALQKCEQSNYVHSSNSDMYHVNVSGRQEVQPFPGLFKKETFDKFNPNTCDLGKSTFNNSTRVQLLQMCNDEKRNDYQMCKD